MKHIYGRGHAPRRTAGVALLVSGLFAGLALSALAPAAEARPSPAKKKPAVFGIGPASAKRIDGRPYLSYLASPGARLIDHVGVVNLTTHPLTLNVYSADAAVSADGGFGYLVRDAPHHDASAWITVATAQHRSTITLPARATAILPVTLRIPHNAPPGDHAAGVIASLTSKVINKNGERVNFEQRVALRTFVRVSGPLHPGLSVDRLRTHYRPTGNPVGGGTVRVTYTVRNTGNVRLGAHQQVSISGLLGTRRPAKAMADVPLLLPGSAVNVSVVVPDVLPQLRLHARVVLHPLVVTGDVDPGVPTRISASSGFWAIPWTLAAILAGLLAALVTARLWRRRGQVPLATPPSRPERMRA